MVGVEIIERPQIEKIAEIQEGQRLRFLAVRTEDGFWIFKAAEIVGKNQIAARGEVVHIRKGNIQLGILDEGVYEIGKLDEIRRQGNIREGLD